MGATICLRVISAGKRNVFDRLSEVCLFVKSNLFCRVLLGIGFVMESEQTKTHWNCLVAVNGDAGIKAQDEQGAAA